MIIANTVSEVLQFSFLLTSKVLTPHTEAYIRSLEETINELRAIVEEQQKIIKHLTAEVAALKVTVAEQKIIIAELRAQIRRSDQQNASTHSRHNSDKLQQSPQMKQDLAKEEMLIVARDEDDLPMVKKVKIDSSGRDDRSNPLISARHRFEPSNTYKSN